jgi:glucose/arabinose dehydrogenase
MERTRWFGALPRLVATGLLVAAALSAGSVTHAAAQEEDVFPIGEEEEPGKEYRRIVNPSALQVPPGYKVEVFARDLNFPTDLTFGPNGEAYVAESGAHFYGTNPKKAPPARILQILPGGRTRVVFDKNVPAQAIIDADTERDIPEGIIGPLEGITYNPRNGLIYLAHRSRYSVLNPQTGEFKTIIGGLPAWGIFHNSKVIFDPQGRMVFEVSAQENAGLVDKPMAEVLAFYKKPEKREVPCETVTLTGKEFKVANLFTKEKGDTVQTGIYVPFGTRTQPGMTIEGEFWCNGAFYRANPDGTNAQRIAWGLRDPYHYAYSPAGRLITTNNGGEAFPNRPIFDDWDTVYEVREGAWYGWPDYYSGVPVTDKRFRLPNDPNYKGKPFEHDFVLTEDTRARLLKNEPLPPQPLVRIEPPHVGAQGFVFGRPEWGLDPENQIILAEFGTLQFLTTKGPTPPGFMLSIIDLRTGERRPFITNKVRPASASPEPGKGEPKGGGFERPLRPVWGPDGALYLVDFGRLDSMPDPKKKRFAFPNTGVIWKITRTDGAPAERTRIPVRKGR